MQLWENCFKKLQFWRQLQIFCTIRKSFAWTISQFCCTFSSLNQKLQREFKIWLKVNYKSLQKIKTLAIFTTSSLRQISYKKYNKIIIWLKIYASSKKSSSFFEFVLDVISNRLF